MHDILRTDLITGLKLLWKECFSEDDDAYIDFFFQNRFDEKNLYYEMENGEIYAAVHLLPCYVTIDGREQKALYGYAGGLRKKFRGLDRFKGVVENMLQKNPNVFLFCPKESLVDYYKQMGFVPCFCQDMIETDEALQDENKKNDLKISPLESAAYENMRNDFFQGEGYVRWDLNAIDYALKEKRFCGGFTHLLHYKEHQYALIGEVKDQQLILEETTIPEEQLYDLLPSLCNIYGASRGTAYVRGKKTSDPMCKKHLIGMSNHLITHQNAYMGLTLI
ncbi:MAG: GNAT family N-acetyltransferase [Clostridia bacterium]|nr:GNAT family N-acetyltransferase [Clostridia bacterium]